MIEFEGFGLENPEQNIIDKQFSTQPRILKQFMTALGAKEGSSSTARHHWQTQEQQDLFGDVLSGYKDLEYKGPGEFTEGKKADELEGFKATDMDSLRKLKDEGRLSLAGLEKLRNYGATAATQVNPDIEGLRNLSKGAWSGYDAQLAETTREARRRLNAADVSLRRGGTTGGTALTRGIGQNIGEYGKTVGEATARMVEANALNRQRLAMEGYQRAGSLGLGATQQGLQGLSLAQSGELGELQMRAQDLAQRRGIHSQERQYEGQNELQRARYSAERADARNLWNMQGSQNQNQFALDRLRGAKDAATTRTFEDVVTKTRGTAGFGGTLLKVGGTVAGAYLGGMVGNPMLGASIGGQLGQGLSDSSGDWGGGGGGYSSGGGNMMTAGLNAYYQNRGTTGGTGGTYNPTVPGRSYGTPPGHPTSMGYGGDYGEFGGTAGSTGYSGSFNPNAPSFIDDDPWGQSGVSPHYQGNYGGFNQRFTGGSPNSWGMGGGGQVFDRGYTYYNPRQYGYGGAG